MLTTDQINDLHRLYWSEHWPIRKIERQLNMGWKTIQKYLVAQAQSAAQRDRPSKLDPFKDIITEWLEKDPRVTAAVVEQKLRSLGYQGGHSIVREYVRHTRPKVAPSRRCDGFPGTPWTADLSVLRRLGAPWWWRRPRVHRHLKPRPLPQ